MNHFMKLTSSVNLTISLIDHIEVSNKEDTSLINGIKYEYGSHKFALLMVSFRPSWKRSIVVGCRLKHNTVTSPGEIHRAKKLILCHAKILFVIPVELVGCLIMNWIQETTELG